MWLLCCSRNLAVAQTLQFLPDLSPEFSNMRSRSHQPNSWKQSPPVAPHLSFVPHIFPGSILAPLEKRQTHGQVNATRKKTLFTLRYVGVRSGLCSRLPAALPWQWGRESRAGGCLPRATGSSWAAASSHKRCQGRSDGAMLATILRSPGSFSSRLSIKYFISPNCILTSTVPRLLKILWVPFNV